MELKGNAIYLSGFDGFPIHVCELHIKAVGRWVELSTKCGSLFKVSNHKATVPNARIDTYLPTRDILLPQNC